MFGLQLHNSADSSTSDWLHKVYSRSNDPVAFTQDINECVSNKYPLYDGKLVYENRLTVSYWHRGNGSDRVSIASHPIDFTRPIELTERLAKK